MKKLSVISTFVIALCMSGSAKSAKADLLNLTNTYPDIASFFVGVAYDSSIDQFAAFGTPFQLAISPSITGDIFNGFFGILANIDDTGTPLGGELTIAGSFVSSTPATVLLHGTINQFGFQNPPGGSLFEFTFDVDGGDLAPAFGSKVGVILNAGADFGGDFTNSFFNGEGSFSSTADTFGVAVPSPTSTMLGVIGGAMLLAYRRRQHVAPATQL